jgi:hypothetical protein
MSAITWSYAQPALGVGVSLFMLMADRSLSRENCVAKRSSSASFLNQHETDQTMEDSPKMAIIETP